jgi:hypothetical protein
MLTAFAINLANAFAQSSFRVCHFSLPMLNALNPLIERSLFSALQVCSPFFSCGLRHVNYRKFIQLRNVNTFGTCRTGVNPQGILNALTNLLN